MAAPWLRDSIKPETRVLTHSEDSQMSLYRSATLVAAMMAAAAALTPRAGLAQDLQPVDRASIQVGFTLPDFDTSVRADGQSSNGTPIDLSRDLGLESSNVVGSLGLSWRPWDNHEFSLTYFNDDSDATRRISRDISFDGTDYTVNSTLRTEMDVDAYTLAYVWWMKNESNWALGPRVGLIYYDIDLSLQLTVDSAGNAVSGGARASTSPQLPVPVIGGSWRWVPAKDWRLKLDAGYFNADIDNIDGSVYYLNGGVEWFPWQNWGLTLNYSRQSIDVNASRNAFNGDLDFVNSTATLGVIYRF